MRATYLDTLARQHGVATFAQLIAGGLTRAQIWGMIRTQRLHVISRSVLRDTTHDFSPHVGMSAAALISGGAVDRQWALFVWGLAPEPQPPITVTIGRDKNAPTSSAFIELDCRRRTLRPHDVTEVERIAVTSVPITLFDLLCSRDRKAAATLDRALQLKMVTIAEMRDCLRHYQGVVGIAAAAKLIAIAAGGSESEAERLFLALLQEAGITGFVQQVAFGRWRLDFAHPLAKVCVEIDGWVWHRQLDRKRNDDAKHNALSSAGWVTLRFGWHDLVDDPDRVCRTVSACLAGRLSA